MEKQWNEQYRQDCLKMLSKSDLEKINREIEEVEKQRVQARLKVWKDFKHNCGTRKWEYL